MNCTKIFLSLIAINIIPSIGSGYIKSTSSEVASENSFQKQTVNIGEYVEIESDGSPFYLSFDKVRDEGEGARFCYIMDEFEASNDELESNAGFFIGDSSHIENSYKDASNTNYRSFGDMIGTGGGLPESIEEAKYYCFGTDRYTTVIPLVSGDNINVLVRDSLSLTNQRTLGADYSNKSLDDGCCYGYYFDGVKVKMSFLTTFEYFQQPLTIHFQDGVKVSVNNETVSPTIVSDYYPVKEKDEATYINDPGSFPIYNSGLCYIPFTKKEVDKSLIVEYDHIEVNDEVADLKLINEGTSYYLITKLASKDTLEIVCSTKVAREESAENVQIYDLYDVANSTKVDIKNTSTGIVVNGDKVYNKSENGCIGIGNIPNTVNNAFRFNITLSSYHYTKFGIWTSNSGIWSNFGYIIRFGPEQKVYILSGEEQEYAQGRCAAVIPGAKISVVVGMAKLYDENNRWFANRIYVDINGERICEYNDVERRSFGSAIIAPYFDTESQVIFEDYRIKNLVAVNNDGNEHVHTNNALYALKGEKFTAKFVLDEGYKFKTFTCNGVDVLNSLKFDNGFYTYIVNSVESALNFSYTLLSDVSVNLSLNGELLDSTFDAKPLYGSKPTISFRLAEGKAPSSIKVNGEEKIKSLTRNGNVYSLNLDTLIEDTVVSIQSEDKTFSASVGSNNDSHAKVSFENNVISIGGSTRVDISLDEGYFIKNVIVEGDATLSTYDGAYFLDNVYSDVSVSVVTAQAETTVIEQVKEFNWPVCIAIIACSVAAVVMIVLILLGIKLKKKGTK